MEQVATKRRRIFKKRLPKETKQPEINGFVAPGFQPVLEVFKENFEKRGELGAAVCAYWRGEKVVDLWGGWRDARKQLPWNEDTLIIVFSTTKGMSALSFALLHSQKLFHYDDKVAKYWPEFAQKGKGDITIRQLLAHQAGLCAPARPLRVKTLLNNDKLAGILAEQTPMWNPGDHQGYHAWTIALYIDQLIQRIDPKKRRLQQFFDEEIAKKLNIDFFIGLPKDIDGEQLAELVPFSKLHFLLKRDPSRNSSAMKLLKPWSLWFKALLNPRFTINLRNFNKRKFQALPIGSACGFGNARAIATLYNEFALGGIKLDIHEDTLAELESEPILPLKWEKDLVLELPIHFSLGMGKPSTHLNFGTNHRSYGNCGAGGSGGFADPEKKVAYAYVMNKMGTAIANDPREVALRRIVWDCISNQESNE